MYVILGATGHTGSLVANTLLGKKKKVRAVGRDNTRLAAFTRRGAEAFTANITDEKALSRAFTDAEAVYAMIPPDLANDNYRGFQSLASNAIAKALENAGVKHAVTLSSFGADKPDKTGPDCGTARNGNEIEPDQGAERPAFAGRVLHGEYLATGRSDPEVWKHVQPGGCGR